VAVETVYEGEDSASPSYAPDQRPQPAAWVLRLAVALTLVPLAVSALHLSVRYGNAYKPGGDLALAELWMRDVGRRPVLVGLISRDGWHHPGPVAYYLMALPYRLLGSRATAVDVAALAVNAAAVTGIATYARRRGGAALMLISLLGCALLMRSLGADEVRLPWNPYVTVLPYALLVFLVWSLVCGDRWALPWAALVASFVAQTHIGYVVLALPLVMAGVAGLVVTTVRRSRRDLPDAPSARSLAAPSLAALAIVAVAWLPPLYQELTTEGGNLTLARRWFASDGGGGIDRPQTLRAGWRIVTSQLGLPPEWLFGNRGTIFTAEPISMYEPLAPLLVVGVVLAGVVLVRRRVVGGGSLLAVWGLASVVGIVAVARTIGPVFEYRLGWAHVLGMLSGVIMAWAGWLALTGWRPRLEQRLLVPGALVGLAVLAVGGSVAHVRAGVPQPVESRQIRTVTPAIVDGLPAGDGVVLVDAALSFAGGGHAAAIVLQLDRAGVDARVTTGNTAAGEHRAYDPQGDGEPRAHLHVAVGDEIAVVDAIPGTTLLARAEGATPEPGQGEPNQFSPEAPVADMAVFLVDDVASAAAVPAAPTATDTEARDGVDDGADDGAAGPGTRAGDRA
jgi:hypothetical protein